MCGLLSRVLGLHECCVARVSVDWAAVGDDDDDGEGSSGSSSKRSKVDAAAAPAEQPDVIDLNAAEWEKKMTALHFALSLGRLEMVKLLIQAGAKPDVMVQDTETKVAIAPLALLPHIAKHDPATAASILSVLVAAGVSVKQLDLNMRNVLHIAASQVCAAGVVREQGPSRFLLLFQVDCRRADCL